MAVLTDFLAAVNQIAAERGIEPDEVFEALDEAIRTGYKKKYGTGEQLLVEFDKENGGVAVYADKKVVEEVTNEATQIAVEDARKIEPKLKVGDHVQVDITSSSDFGRIAVQAAKQVILQKVREAEKEATIREFKDKMGTIEAGIIQRMDGDSVLVEIHKAIAVMPAEDRLPGEFYRSGDRMKFLLKKISRTLKGKQLIVSRNDPDFLRELFAIEVPEIRSGSVEIKSIAREAGSRSKVAVISNQEGVDPIGACVGQKGIRIDNVTDELKGEKIDIIIWNEDEVTFIANSLSPAEALEIVVDEKNREAKVIVADDQLSLAIGKEGQNVRLAAKLTGWKIDIFGQAQFKEEMADAKKEEKAEKEAEKEVEKKKKTTKKKVTKKAAAKKEVTKTTKKTKTVKKKAVKKTAARKVTKKATVKKTAAKKVTKKAAAKKVAAKKSK